jgi:[ribosomal protein S18]-alanine N-acetyltransferase
VGVAAVRIRAATTEECSAIWPAVNSEHLMADEAELLAYRETWPWAVRVDDRGDACVLGRWKCHLDVLAMRGLWCPERHVRDFVRDAAAIGRDRGFGRLMSPLLPTVLLAPYRSQGLDAVLPIVAIQGRPDAVEPCEPPGDVRLRVGDARDCAAVAALDAACFDEFWSWGVEDLTGFLGGERLCVATDGSGELIGYTLATVHGGGATLTRLAVSPALRGRGVGRALLSEAAAWMVREGAVTLTLCTQEGNAASRALYARAGLVEVDVAYGFALGALGRGER